MEDPTVGNRIILLGCPGSGKSTLAKNLQLRTGLPLYHLDSIWWKADRTHITREEFDRQLQKILQGEKWIIDGDYSRTYEPRFLACDTVIFLDYSEEECMTGIRERIGKTRSDIPWNEDIPDPELVEQVAAYREEKRPKVLSLIEKNPEKKVLVFRTRAQAQEWISAGEPAAW